MFGPRDATPPPVKVAVTFRHIYEGGKHYVVISFGQQDEWQKIQINRSQVSGFIQDALPRVLLK